MKTVQGKNGRMSGVGYIVVGGGVGTTRAVRDAAGLDNYKLGRAGGHAK